MAILFISDLHLDGSRPHTGQLFLHFLTHQASGQDALYILGDLFEAWLGDDLVLPEYRPYIEALQKLADQGTSVYVLHGNRDFLLGAEFERLSGVQLIEEGTVIDLYGTPTLLLHGDSLCTDDHAYQQLRQMVREPAWIAGFLAKSPEQRIAFAQQLRERSREETGSKAESIMDASDKTIQEAMEQAGVLQLIHGHTHRQAQHTLDLSGHKASRWVLGDWDTFGNALTCDDRGCRFILIDGGN